MYDEQVQSLKKMFAKELEDMPMVLKKAKQHMKTSIERREVKVHYVFLWGLLCVVTIAFAIK